MTIGHPGGGRSPAPERQLRADRNRFVAFALAGGSLLLELDATGRLKSALGAVSNLTGRAPEELIGRPAHELFAPEHHAAFDRALAHLARHQQLPPTPLALLRPGANGAQPTANSLWRGLILAPPRWSDRAP